MGSGSLFSVRQICIEKQCASFHMCCMESWPAPQPQVWGSVVRLADILGAVEHHRAGIYPGTFVNLGTFGCGSPILQQFSCEEKWTKQLWPVQWVLSASPGNTWSAEFTAVTDYFSNNLQGCLSHFPDCECMEIFLGISSLELRLRKTHLPLIKDSDQERIPEGIKLNSRWC